MEQGAGEKAEVMDNEQVVVPAEPLAIGTPIFGFDMRDSKNVLKAYLEAQRNMGKVIRNKRNAAFGASSKYADLSAVLEAVDVALQDAGLVLMQPFQYEPIDGKHVLMLYTCIAHADSGEAIVTALPLPALPDPQKLGSAITYFRRYSIMNMMGLAPEDDDGNAASGAKAPTVAGKTPASTPKAPLGPNKENLKTVLLGKGATDKAKVAQLLDKVGVTKAFADITESEAPAIINKLESVSDF